MSDEAGPSEAGVVPVHALSPEKEKSLRELYDSLDANRDGRIDVKELRQALQRHSPHLPSSYAKALTRYKKSLSENKEDAVIADRDFMSKADLDHSSTVSFKELVHYVLEHEKRLAVVFSSVDKNKDGLVDREEIMNYFKDLGIPISSQEADKIVARVSQDGSATIDLAEFQKFLLFLPSLDAKSLAHFWIHSMVIDIGEDCVVPEDFSSSEIQKGVWWRHLVAGGAAGAVSRTLTAPLDRLKVFLQVHATRANNLGVRSGMAELYLEGGVKGLWRGNGVNVIKIAPESAIKFMAYEQAKRFVARNNDGEELSNVQRLCAGSFAGAFAQTCIYPLEVMKTRLALRRSGHLNRGILPSMWSITRAEGIASLYKGYWPNLLGIIPYAGIDLAVYERLKRLYVESTGHDEPGVIGLLGCGAASSSCGMLASYPLALVRTRLQSMAEYVQARGAPGAPPDKGGTTMLSQFRHIWSHEGPVGFYRGLVPNYLKVIDIGEDAVVPEDFSSSEIRKGVWLAHLVAGGVAGAVSRTLTAPLDRLKVFLQVHATRANNLGVRSGMAELYAEGGVKGLWRGNGVNVIKIAPESAIKFMAYEQAKRFVSRKNNGGELSMLQRLCAGSFAGGFAQTCIYPLEVMKTRLALRRSGHLNRGILPSMWSISRAEGVVALYKGYWPNLLGIIPYAGIDLAVYERLKGLHVESTGHDEPGVMGLLGCGAASSSCGMLASYPLALVKTRLQARGAPGAPPDKGGTTMLSQFRHIWSHEGLVGFYRGLLPNYLKVLPAVSISYVVYEHVREALGVQMT